MQPATVSSRRPVVAGRAKVGLDVSAPIRIRRAPRGIGLAVAVDWALAVGLVVLALAGIAGVHPRLLHGAATRVTGSGLYTLVLLYAAALLYGLGDGLRRGLRRAWRAQLVADGLETVAGLAAMAWAVVGARAGDPWHPWLLIPLAVLVVLSPLTVWQLSRPATGAWIAHTERVAALRRHDRRWLLRTGSIGIISGLLAASAVLYG